jgi:hypothetical protein
MLSTFPVGATRQRTVRAVLPSRPDPERAGSNVPRAA